MKVTNYSEFAEMRAELLRDYAPVNAQERLLVNEVAETWRRVRDARRREELFFDLQVFAEAQRAGRDPGEFRKNEGAEVAIFLDHPHKGYDQILLAIRDAERAFNNAIKRIEEVQDRRLRRERLLRKEKPQPATEPNPVVETHTAGISARISSDVALPPQPMTNTTDHPLRN